MKRNVMLAVLTASIVGSAQAVDLGAAVTKGVSTYNVANKLKKDLPSTIKALQDLKKAMSSAQGTEKATDIVQILSLSVGVMDDAMLVLQNAIETIAALYPKAQDLLYAKQADVPTDDNPGKLSGPIGQAKAVVALMRTMTTELAKMLAAQKAAASKPGAQATAAAAPQQATAKEEALFD